MTSLLPVESFRQILGYHPFHFWQMSNSSVPLTSSCNALVYQHAWQGVDAAGREDIALAIEAAETRLREYLGYSVMERYLSETLPFPQFQQRNVSSLAYAGADGRWLSLQLSEMQVQAIGAEKRTLVGDAAIVLSDEDGDGLKESFTATIATTETDATKIACYFSDDDRLDSEDVSERWRIMPVRVSIAGGTATIRGKSWMLVKPILYEGVASTAIDPSDATKLVSAVEVHVRSTDYDNQGTLIWETLPYPHWACCSTSSDPAATATALARVGLRDSTTGIVSLGEAFYDAATGTWSSSDCMSWCRPPDRVTVNYLAGVPLVNQEMDKTWQMIVARLAMAELVRPICACDTANRQLYHWQTDLARSAGNNDEQFGAISQSDLDNPFGTRRGHVYAWRAVRNLRLLRGFAL